MTEFLKTWQDARLQLFLEAWSDETPQAGGLGDEGAGFEGPSRAALGVSPSLRSQAGGVPVRGSSRPGAAVSLGD